MALSILLEGPDGSGKTFLAKALAKGLSDSSYIHGTHVEKENAKKVFDDMLREIKSTLKSKKNIIIDRFLYSYIIYEGLFYGDDANTRIEDLNKYRDAYDIQIFCLPPDKDSYLQKFKELKERREESFSDMNEVYDCFHHLVTGSLHEGQKEDRIKNSFYQDIISEGGLIEQDNCFIFDMFSQTIWDKHNVPLSISEFVTFLRNLNKSFDC